MKKIASFTVDHNKLDPGVYISRIDGDVITYDIRVKKPNQGDYLSNPALHTIEHLFATYARNSELSDSVIYFGPMGCRTGFYLLLRDSVSKKRALTLIQDTFEFIQNYSGEIPGSDKKECGNYLEHDLYSAKEEAKEYLKVITNLTDNDLEYETNQRRINNVGIS